MITLRDATKCDHGESTPASGRNAEALLGDTGADGPLGPVPLCPRPLDSRVRCTPTFARVATGADPPQWKAAPGRARSSSPSVGGGTEPRTGTLVAFNLLCPHQRYVAREE